MPSSGESMMRDEGVKVGVKEEGDFIPTGES